MESEYKTMVKHMKIAEKRQNKNTAAMMGNVFLKYAEGDECIAHFNEQDRKNAAWSLLIMLLAGGKQ